MGLWHPILPIFFTPTISKKKHTAPSTAPGVAEATRRRTATWRIIQRWVVPEGLQWLGEWLHGGWISWLNGSMNGWLCWGMMGECLGIVGIWLVIWLASDWWMVGYMVVDLMTWQIVSKWLVNSGEWWCKIDNRQQETDVMAMMVDTGSP